MVNIRIIRALATLIMVATASVSYQTQQHLFLDWKVDAFTAAVAPLSIDMLAIICSLAIHTDGVARKGKVVAVFVLVVTGSGSIAANWIAGETVGSKAVHGGMVVLYLMAEWVASLVRKAPEVDNAGSEQDQGADITADDAVVPVSPAPAGTSTRQPYGPRNGQDYSPRQKRRQRTGR